MYYRTITNCINITVMSLDKILSKIRRWRGWRNASIHRFDDEKPFLLSTCIKTKRNKMSGVYAKRVTWLACNTNWIRKVSGFVSFQVTFLLLPSKGLFSGKDTRDTLVTCIQPTGTKYQVIPQGEASFLRVACADYAVAMSEITHNLTFDTVGCSSPPRSELESQRLLTFVQSYRTF